MSAIFDFTHAIVRTPGLSVAQGLRDGEGPDPDFGRVLIEHATYVDALRDAGVEVDLLPPEEGYPDSIFVEDTALVFGEGAILLRPGAESRAGEAGLIEPVLRRHFDTVLALETGHVDGGDVLVTPSAVIIGLSHRTDRQGAEALSGLLARLGKTALVADTPKGVLHFKTGCSLVDEETVFALPAMVGCEAFAGLRVVETPEGEEGAANLMRVTDRVFIGEHWPKSIEMLGAMGADTVPLPVSEIAKIDAGLSCMSLRWKGVE